MPKKVSIIIPAYNAEKHLSKCIDSVLDQTVGLDEIEVVIGNDGSTDRTEQIIDQYATLYPDTIQVDTHGNLGVAETRNRALKRATGEYILFLDADDRIEKDYCQRYIEVAVKTQADVVYGGYKRMRGDGTVIRTYPSAKGSYGKYIVVGVCSKMYKRTFLRDNNISFSNKVFGEDVLFTLMGLSKSRRWENVDDVGYNYLMNEHSVTNTIQKKFSKENEARILDLLEDVLDIGKDSLIEEDNLPYRFFTIKTMVYHLLYSRSTMDLSQMVDLQRSMVALVEIKYTKSFFKGFEFWFFMPKGESLPVVLTVKIYSLVIKTKSIYLFSRVLQLFKKG